MVFHTFLHKLTSLEEEDEDSVEVITRGPTTRDDYDEYLIEITEVLPKIIAKAPSNTKGAITRAIKDSGLDGNAPITEEFITVGGFYNDDGIFCGVEFLLENGQEIVLDEGDAALNPYTRKLIVLQSRRMVPGRVFFDLWAPAEASVMKKRGLKSPLAPPPPKPSKKSSVPKSKPEKKKKALPPPKVSSKSPRPTKVPSSLPSLVSTNSKKWPQITETTIDIVTESFEDMEEMRRCLGVVSVAEAKRNYTKSHHTVAPPLKCIGFEPTRRMDEILLHEDPKVVYSKLYESFSEESCSEQYLLPPVAYHSKPRLPGQTWLSTTNLAVCGHTETYTSKPGDTSVRQELISTFSDLWNGFTYQEKTNKSLPSDSGFAKECWLEKFNAFSWTAFCVGEGCKGGVGAFTACNVLFDETRCRCLTSRLSPKVFPTHPPKRGVTSSYLDGTFQPPSRSVLNQQSLRPLVVPFSFVLKQLNEKEGTHHQTSFSDWREAWLQLGTQQNMCLETMSLIVIRNDPNSKVLKFYLIPTAYLSLLERKEKSASCPPSKMYQLKDDMEETLAYESAIKQSQVEWKLTYSIADSKTIYKYHSPVPSVVVIDEENFRYDSLRLQKGQYPKSIYKVVPQSLYRLVSCNFFEKLRSQVDSVPTAINSPEVCPCTLFVYKGFFVSEENEAYEHTPNCLILAKQRAYEKKELEAKLADLVEDEEIDDDDDDHREQFEDHCTLFTHKQPSRLLPSKTVRKQTTINLDEEEEEERSLLPLSEAEHRRIEELQRMSESKARELALISGINRKRSRSDSLDTESSDFEGEPAQKPSHRGSKMPKRALGETPSKSVVHQQQQIQPYRSDSHQIQPYDQDDQTNYDSEQQISTETVMMMINNMNALMANLLEDNHRTRNAVQEEVGRVMEMVCDLAPRMDALSQEQRSGINALVEATSAMSNKVDTNARIMINHHTESATLLEDMTRGIISQSRMLEAQQRQQPHQVSDGSSSSMNKSSAGGPTKNNTNSGNFGSSKGGNLGKSNASSSSTNKLTGKGKGNSGPTFRTESSTTTKPKGKNTQTKTTKQSKASTAPVSAPIASNYGNVVNGYSPPVIHGMPGHAYYPSVQPTSNLSMPSPYPFNFGGAPGYSHQTQQIIQSPPPPPVIVTPTTNTSLSNSGYQNTIPSLLQPSTNQTTSSTISTTTTEAVSSSSSVASYNPTSETLTSFTLNRPGEISKSMSRTHSMINLFPISSSQTFDTTIEPVCDIPSSQDSYLAGYHNSQDLDMGWWSADNRL